MPVVQEEQGLPPQFWEQHVMGWMRNAWGGTASSFPSITTPTWGAPQTPPAPSAPALLPGQQHAQASASRGCASETPFLISFLPPHPDVL